MVNSVKKNKNSNININKWELYVFVIIVVIQMVHSEISIFHILCELFNSFIVLYAAIIVGHCKNSEKASIYDFIGFSFGFMGIFNLLHIFTYGNTAIIKNSTINASMQYSLCSDFVGISTFIIFFNLINNHSKIIHAFKVIYYLAIPLLFFSVAAFKNFPVCITNDGNLTMFVKNTLVILVVLLMFVTFLFIKNKRKIDEDIYGYLLNSAIFLCVYFILLLFSEKNGTAIMIIMNIAKTIAFYSSYKIIVATNLDRSYKLLYYKIEQNNVRLEEEKFQLTKLNKELVNQIKKRKAMEIELLNTQERYKKIIDFLPDAVVAHKNGNIVYVNDAAIKLIKGQKRTDLLGENIYNFVDEKIKGVTLEPIEVKIAQLDGGILDSEISCTSAILNNIKVRLVVIRDISNRKKDIQREKLLNEKIEYEKVRSEFFANISHELRTPINVIYGALQVINLNFQSGKIVDESGNLNGYVKSIKQNCFRLIRLVNNLIDSTKIDAGYFQFHMKNYNIIEIVENITISVVEFAKSKNIEITFDTDVEEKYMACDPNLIERIILNLISNSIKFTKDDGKIEVIVTDKDEFLQIQVKDNGIGIPKEKIETVFERFRQANKSLSREREGSGIGLSLVKSIIEMQGGNIKVESENDKGSTFTILLPVTLENENEIANDYCIQDDKVAKIDIEFSDIYL